MNTAASLKVWSRRWYPHALVMRRALCIAIAVGIAVWVDRYYSLLHEGWVGLATVLMLQMTVRTNLQQEMARFVVIMAAVWLGSSLLIFFPWSIYLLAFYIFLFIVACFVQNYFPARARGFTPALMVALIMLLMLPPFSLGGNILFDRTHDVVLGGVIGIVAGLTIFPGRPDVDFRVGVIPVLRAYGLYITAITEVFFQMPDALKNADNKKIAIEKTLQSQQVFFPAWVYEKGFAVSLRAGHRHFLMRVEQMGQVLFAMNYAARHPVRAEMLDQFRTPILTCVEDFKTVIANLIKVLNEAALTTTSEDFAADVMFLENNFQAAIEMPYELAETSPDYMHVTRFIYGLKNLQTITAKLEEALRAYIKHLDYSR